MQLFLVHIGMVERITVLACLLVFCTFTSGYYYTRQKCSRMCPCYYQSLFCRGYRYSEFPSDLSVTVQNIDFQDNYISELDNTTLANYTALRKLLLGSNEISDISKDAFASQRELNALDLSDNLLDEVSISTFNPIRKKLEHLTLEGNNISRVTGLFRNMRVLKTLNLKRNSIKFISLETFFQNRKLRFLQLAHNNINNLPEDTFSKQGELVYLYLDYNPVNVTSLKLRSKVLTTLSMSHCNLIIIPAGLPKSIKQLNLAGNAIEAVDRNDLAHMRQLDSVDLSNNNIANIDSKAFRNLQLLQVLYMSANSLTDMPRRLPSSLVQLALDRNLISFLARDVLSSTYRLRELALDNNMIEYMHRKAFSNLTDLQSLSLSVNVLTRLPAGQFEALIALKSLDLSDNPWHNLEPGCLDGLWSLDSLSIANTPSKLRVKTGLLPDSPVLRILNIHNSESVARAILKWDAPMHNLRSVEYLDLMRNNIQTLHETIPQTLTHLRRIQLSANPWRCDRKLYWLQSWLSRGDVEEPHSNHIYCETPQSLRGKRLINLNAHDWIKNDNNDITQIPP